MVFANEAAVGGVVAATPDLAERTRAGMARRRRSERVELGRGARWAVVAAAGALFAAPSAVARAADSSPTSSPAIEVSVDELVAAPQQYDGALVAVSGVPALDETFCTLRACFGENACCNRCSAHYALRSGSNPGTAVVLWSGGPEELGCTGTNCDWSNACTLGTFVTSPYRFEGHFVVDRSGALRLKITHYERIKQE